MGVAQTAEFRVRHRVQASFEAPGGPGWIQGPPPCPRVGTCGLLVIRPKAKNGGHLPLLSPIFNGSKKSQKHNPKKHGKVYRFCICNRIQNPASKRSLIRSRSRSPMKNGTISSLVSKESAKRGRLRPINNLKLFIVG